VKRWLNEPEKLRRLSKEDGLMQSAILVMLVVIIDNLGYNFNKM